MSGEEGFNVCFNSAYEHAHAHAQPEPHVPVTRKEAKYSRGGGRAGEAG